jgi:protein-disulfide isomerase
MRDVGDRRAPDQARLAAEQAAARRRERRILVAVLVGFVLVLVVGGIGLQAWRAGRTPTAVSVPATAAGGSPVTLADGRPLVLGQPDAPVTVTLYEDFHCPHCADFEAELGSTLTTAQGSGQVKIELFPMAFIDQGSTAAANAMGCAAQAGIGQGYYLGLFANHTLRWSDDQLVDLGDQTGVADSGSFAACVRTRANARWVDSINSAADRNGVTSTPTMFLDSQPVNIAKLTPESLQAQIADAARN